jgi:N-acetylmuramoyl-L-alanine amidase
MNTFPTADCEGVQVWYSQNDERSALLAKQIQDTVKAHLQPSNNRRTKAATSGIYLLRHAKTPAVLVECGFLSTPSECEQLCDTLYQQKLALTLFDAICENLNACS